MGFFLSFFNFSIKYLVFEVFNCVGKKPLRGFDFWKQIHVTDLSGIIMATRTRPLGAIFNNGVRTGMGK